MKIKSVGSDRTHLVDYKLSGSSEVELTKGFAWLLGMEGEVLYEFLRIIGIKSMGFGAKNFTTVSIEAEPQYGADRLDIEITQYGRFHVIVEGKIGRNLVDGQIARYLSHFSGNSRHSVLCLLTGVFQQNRDVQAGNVVVRNITWVQIENMLSQRHLIKLPAVMEFMRFLREGYKMHHQKEILVQDLSYAHTVRQFFNYNLYRRDNARGIPLYFAPHFSLKAARSVNVESGITHLSPVNGLLHMRAADAEQRLDLITAFAKGDPALVGRWLAGLRSEPRESQGSEFTFLFLDDPVQLPTPILKRHTKGSVAELPKQVSSGYTTTMKRLTDWMGMAQRASRNA